jgi:hypothetical protein
MGGYDGSMSYEEFLRYLARADLKPSEFARLLKMNPNSVTNYAKLEEVPSHLAVIAALLAEMHVREIDYRTVLSSVDIAPKKARGAGRFGNDRSE